jgi:hypothetical protein
MNWIPHVLPTEWVVLGSIFVFLAGGLFGQWRSDRARAQGRFSDGGFVGSQTGSYTPTSGGYRPPAGPKSPPPGSILRVFPHLVPGSQPPEMAYRVMRDPRGLLYGNFSTREEAQAYADQANAVEHAARNPAKEAPAQ